MIITERACAYIKEAMEDNGVSTLRFTYEGVEEGTTLWGITLADPEEKDVLETVNGISVAVAPEVVTVAEQVKLDFEDGTLVILGLDD